MAKMKWASLKVKPEPEKPKELPIGTCTCGSVKFRLFYEQRLMKRECRLCKARITL